MSTALKYDTQKSYNTDNYRADSCGQFSRSYLRGINIIFIYFSVKVCTAVPTTLRNRSHFLWLCSQWLGSAGLSVNKSLLHVVKMCHNSCSNSRAEKANHLTIQQSRKRFFWPLSFCGDSLPAPAAEADVASDWDFRSCFGVIFWYLVFSRLKSTREWRGEELFSLGFNVILYYDPTSPSVQFLWNLKVELDK